MCASGQVRIRCVEIMTQIVQGEENDLVKKGKKPFKSNYFEEM